MAKTTIETVKGLSGMLRMFKSVMVDRLGLQPGQRIAFVGCAGTCVPFVELFAYTVRDKQCSMTIIPDGLLAEAREIRYLDCIGMQAGGPADPRGADFVVLLGGISMPSCSLGVEKTNEVVKEVLRPGGKVIGICFMDMFAKAGWEDKVPFDLIVNASIDTVTLSSFK